MTEETIDQLIEKLQHRHAEAIRSHWTFATKDDEAARLLEHIAKLEIENARTREQIYKKAAEEISLDIEEGYANAVREIESLTDQLAAARAEIAELRQEWGACEERNGNLIDAAKAEWAKHGGMEIAKGQWQARAETAEVQLTAAREQITTMERNNAAIAYLVTLMIGEISRMPNKSNNPANKHNLAYFAERISAALASGKEQP